MSKKKFYVVWKGHQPGVYSTWDACKRQIDGYPGARYKGFPSEQEAKQAFSAGGNPSGGGRPVIGTSSVGRPVLSSISVDAACSGNPGVMEYQGVCTSTKKQLFLQKHELGTNNIGEFLAIVHGLAYLKRIDSKLPIYTDSATALSWIRKKKCNSKLERNKKTEELFQIIERAENWLKNNTWTTQLLKWDTKHWGEIPADFGRK